MRTVRVLVLDTPGFIQEDSLSRQEIILEVTELAKEDTWSTAWGGHYRASRRGLDVAQNASLHLYDYVVIGNNRGMGFNFAEVLPEELRSRTVIVWNSSSDRSEIPGYKQLGYSHFGARIKSLEWIMEQLAASSA